MAGMCCTRKITAGRSAGQPGRMRHLIVCRTARGNSDHDSARISSTETGLMTGTTGGDCRTLPSLEGAAAADGDDAGRGGRLARRTRRTPPPHGS